MDISIEKIRSLCKLFLVLPTAELGNVIITHLKQYNNEHGVLTNDKLFIELFTTLLPIYSTNKKSHHVLFDKIVEINLNLIKVVKIETVDLLVRIIKIITNLLVDVDKNGDLNVVNQNDTIKYHILCVLNNFITENSILYGIMLEKDSMFYFYGYLCATMKQLVSNSNNSKMYEECLNYYTIAPKYLLKMIPSSSHKANESKIKIAKCISLFLPGILGVLLDIFKNKSHMKIKLKANTLESFYLYIGVLLNDRWCQLDCVGQFMDPSQNSVVSKNESNKRISFLLKEIVNLVFNENVPKLYIKLANIIDYLFRYCSNLNIIKLLFDITTKILLIDNCETVITIVTSYLRDYIVVSDNNKFYLIQYYTELFQKVVANLMKDDFNVSDNIKLLKICIIICGNNIFIEYMIMKELVTFMANYVKEGSKMNMSVKDVKLYSNNSLDSLMIKLKHVHIQNPNQNHKQTTVKCDINTIDDILQLMIYYGHFMEVTSSCMEIMSDNISSNFIDLWPYIYIITTCIKVYYKPCIMNHLLSIVIFIDNHTHDDTNKLSRLKDLIQDVHDYIFGDQRKFFQYLNGGLYISSQYQMALYELEYPINTDETWLYLHDNINIDQMCINIFDFIEQSSYILSCEYVTCYLARILYMLLMLRCSMANNSNLCDTSYRCLNNITNNVHYNNFKQLVYDFKEVIIDEISIELRYLSWNNKAPIIFKSLVDIVDDNHQDCFSQLIEPLIDIFVNIIENYQDEGFLYSYIAMDAFVEFVLRYNKLKSTETHDQTVSDNMSKYNVFKTQPYHSIYPAMNNNESLLDFYKKHVIHFENVDNEQNNSSTENDDNDESLQKCPPHLERVYKIMSICVHFLNSRSETLRFMVHQLCCKCIMAFDSLEFVIYPMMHKLWDPLLYSITLYVNKESTIKHSTTLVGSIQLLGRMCEFSGIFLKSRIFDQFLPLVQRLCTNNMDKNPCNLNSIRNIIPYEESSIKTNHHGNQYNSEFEIALIQLIPKLVYHFDIHGITLNSLTYTCVEFIQHNYPLNVKKAAIKALSNLIIIEPYIKDLITTIENSINWDNLFDKYHCVMD